MNHLALLLPVAVGAAVVISTPPPPLGEKWNTVQLSRYFWAEGACVADVNRDGHPDVLSGPYWYEGPDFKTRHEIISKDTTFVTTTDEGEKLEVPGFEGALGTKNTYSDNFLTAAHDFNGDGWADYLVVGFPGKETFWYENPAETGGPWKRHVALAVTDNESPQLVDVDGDGQPDLLAMSKGTLGYATYDPADPTAEWTWHAVTEEKPGTYQRFSHGIGAADINGNGRTDILEQHGWWEQPADWDGSSPWTFHPAPFGTKGGAQMYGYDVNQDGRTDVITSLAAHEFGLAWFEQLPDGGWKRHLLTDTADEKGSTGVAFSQPHAIEMADINGNGLLDIVTGKRFWAHGPDGDPESDAAAVVYVFYLNRDDGEISYTSEIIHDDSGIGCQLAIADLNGDGKPDVITANKKGCFVHLQN